MAGRDLEKETWKEIEAMCHRVRILMHPYYLICWRDLRGDFHCNHNLFPLFGVGLLCKYLNHF